MRTAAKAGKLLLVAIAVARAAASFTYYAHALLARYPPDEALFAAAEGFNASIYKVAR